MLFANKELNFDIPRIMGIINLTPDSFSDGGKFFSRKNSRTNLSKVIKEIELMEKSGVSFIDIGAESTRPGYIPISEEEELDRIIPVLNIIKDFDVIFSVDSSKPLVLREAIKSGIGLINDVNSLKDIQSKDEVRNSNLPICIMHKKEKPSELNICEEVSLYFKEQIESLINFGIDSKKIILDPGFGYGKSAKENIEILSSFDYTKFSNKSLVGISRKGFLKKLTSNNNLDDVSISAGIISAMNGANIIRVHNVPDTIKKIGEIFG
jgi:dihydropteroate synthase